MKNPLASKKILDLFLTTSFDDLLTRHRNISPEVKYLSLFQRCAKETPAYSDFLRKAGINPDTINSYEAFKTLPLMGKRDYMQSYPLPERCLGGSLAGADRVAVSSGSTGLPLFWPRSEAYETDSAMRFEQIFRDSFRADETSTLAVVCFALGNWVGGLFTTSCCWRLAGKGYPLMVATPGNNKAEILRVIKELAGYFRQTVLLGYPPFVKDVLDAGRAEGVNWEEHNLKMVFAGEVFSEEWRDILYQRLGSRSPCFDSASLYGTADGGVLGNETPFSIAIRRWLSAHPAAARDLFGESRLPTLVQYDPVSRFFETHDGTLVVSGENSVPLLRYHIADSGGIIEFEAMWDFLRGQGIGNLSALGLPADFQPRVLPFVFVFGRADFTVSFYGANIYPENVTVGLEQPDFMGWISGKFVLESQENAEGDKYLHIAVELLPGIAANPEIASRLGASVSEQLLRLNSEFANYTPPERRQPCISLYPFADPDYFPAGAKHRYTRR